MGVLPLELLSVLSATPCFTTLMDEKISLKEFERRWAILLSRKLSSPQETKNDSSLLFDCSSLVIPPRIELINSTAQTHVDRWKQLDERKVPEEFLTGEARPAWYNKHVRLPPGFDYATHSEEAPVDDGSGDRIVSLQDPTKYLSYRQELWELFRGIPLASRVEKDAISGHQLTNLQRLHDTLTSRKTSSNIEYPALGRIRMSDRHGIVPDSYTSSATTLVIELWRKPPQRRASTPDADRMVLEFRGYQTLLDVHRAIVELSRDKQWSKIRGGATSQQDGSQLPPVASGYFLVEGIFYTIGEVDYVTSIQTWLQSGSPEDQYRRRVQLGIHQEGSSKDTRPLPVKSMATTRLEDIETRLAVRYVHVHHGNMECSMYIVDRKVGSLETKHYPVIHDIWTSSSAKSVDCEACQVRLATCATSDTCPITLGHRLLCAPCAKELQIFEKYPQHIEDYEIWCDSK